MMQILPILNIAVILFAVWLIFSGAKAIEESDDRPKCEICGRPADGVTYGISGGVVVRTIFMCNECTAEDEAFQQQLKED